MKNKLFFAGLFLVISLGTIAAALFFGGSDLPVNEITHAVFHPGAQDTASIIVWKLRFPRLLIGLLSGMGLAACGCVFQGMLKNPLADPYTLGISGGAALGVAIASVAGIAKLGAVFIPLCAFIGSMISVVFVFVAASRRQFSISMMLLSGVILGFLFSSLVLLIFAVADTQKIHATLMWLMGDLSSAPYSSIKLSALIVLPGIAVLSFFGRELNILTLGDEKAKHLGVETVEVKQFLFVIASLITAVCVSVAGVIGFVGIIMPHFVRKITGNDHRTLIPIAALSGGLFLALSDTIARTIIAPVELPAGVITGILGGIVFLFIVMRNTSIKL
jgi:iron complex transport system permease protein